jgi:nucleoside-diphosphate-sugar epimerase
MSPNNGTPSSTRPDPIVRPDDLLLVTGASGFIGSRVLENLVARGFRNLRVLVRPSSQVGRLQALAGRLPARTRLDIVTGNLLSREDCAAVCANVAVVFNLAAARGEKSIPDAFMNSVVTTRNLLDACPPPPTLRRFVHVSSFAVYSNRGARWPRVLDESSRVETRPQVRGDAYSYAKIKQEELVVDYGRRLRLPCVIVRPGYVYGSGHEAITGRVGIGSFGIFLHLGGRNPIPFTYVDNCADAIVLAGVTPGIDGEVFNVVDDDLPSSRHFLRLYKRHVGRFASVYLPHPLSYVLCWLWESYSRWSEGQLPPAYNRSLWHAYWKRTRYTNHRAKARLGWSPAVPTAEGLTRYFAACRRHSTHA